MLSHACPHDTPLPMFLRRLLAREHVLPLEGPDQRVHKVILRGFVPNVLGRQGIAMVYPNEFFKSKACRP